MSKLTSVVPAIDCPAEARYTGDRAAIIAKEQHAQPMLWHGICGTSSNILRRLVRASAEAKLVEDTRRMLNELAADISRHGRFMVEELLPGGVRRHVPAASKCDVPVVHERY